MIKPVCLELNEDFDENNNDLKGIFTDTEEILDIDFDELDIHSDESSEQENHFKTEKKSSKYLLKDKTPTDNNLKEDPDDVIVEKTIESDVEEVEIIKLTDENKNIKNKKVTRLEN